MKTKKLAVMLLLVLGNMILADLDARELTNEERSCLESKIGRPSSHNRPTQDAISAAFRACNLEMSAFSAPGGKKEPFLTDDQRSCLTKMIGKPSERNNISRAQLESAFAACGVKSPN